MNLLPIVDADIGQSVAQAIENQSEYTEKLLKRISKENPVVAEFIMKWAMLNEDSMEETTLCGLIVYRLLESQAEADKMSEEINI